MSGFIDAYLEAVNKEFKMHATFPPGSLIDLGDIGVLRDGAFIPTSNLKDKGLQFRRVKRDAAPMRFASQRGVKFEGSASGKSSKNVSAIGKLDAGLRISFSQEGALVFVMDPAGDEFIRDVDAVVNWMDAERGRKIKENQVVITHLRRACSGVIAMARSRDAEVQLKTDASLKAGAISLGDVKGKLVLVTSTETEFLCVPTGRSGATPLYRMLGFENSWHHLFTGEPPHAAVAKRMNVNMEVGVGLFPAPEPVRGTKAMRL